MTSSVHNFVLDWPTRLQIAIGAAKGLCHMHENCSAPIIHRDVKSNNILLDAEFNAKIADFGLAKMLVKQGEPDTMSGIAGSYGYIAPEYAYTTKVNEKIDVYSFGVVLLELVTGREPNSGDEHMCLVEWAWDQFKEGKTIEEVMDEEIKEQCERAQVTTLFSLGLMCTTTLPSTRPTMKEVLEILRQCNEAKITCNESQGKRNHHILQLAANQIFKNLYIIFIYILISCQFWILSNKIFYVKKKCNINSIYYYLISIFTNQILKMNRPNATKMPKVNFLFAKIPFPALFLLLVLSLPFQVIFENLDDELSILLDVKQQLGNPLICDLKNLIVLDVSNNYIPGKFSDILNCSKLEHLLLKQNFFPSALPKEFGALKKLKYLWMTEANLIGEIPESFNNLSNLELLDLSVNKLEGTIPGGMLTLKNLNYLHLFINRLSGHIPSSIEALNLKQIDLSDNHLMNKLSGELPQHLYARGALLGVVASNNNLSGEVPTSLGNCTSLLTIQVEIANNKFYGPIPAEISSWMNISVLNANNNMLSGKIPVELTSLWNITVLLLDENQFSGELPSQIISWKSLNKLNLSRNKLSGLIPKALGSLTSLSYLDLSENQFSGQIPPKLGHLNLIILHLSSNQLSGMVPIECDAKPVNSDKLSTKYLVMILIFALADLDEYNILSSLTENNLIVCGGSGKVYRVANNRSGELLAVKMICNNRRLDQKLQKQFETEVEILSTMRHANIVKLLCCISNETSSLLVYEYMEKQSLDRWLHGKKQRTSIAGSYGYIAPEYAYTTKVNKKIDVYSFGVVLLELVTGREPNNGDEHMCLAE
ncbi:unnamed protein product, partial [Vitis vinifera]